VKCFGWKIERSRVFGLIERPVAEIFLEDSVGDWQPIVVYVDSGADVTVLKKSFGEVLGIDMEKGEKAALGAVSGAKIETYVHNMKLRIGDHIVKARVAFATDDTPPNLLGRMDIFNLFEIHFRNRTHETCLSKKSV